ncbi:hypothetical protein X011_26970 [Mycobacterium tuberculosis variant microti OV254]|nr:hypothetical protein X011_26970 [Mycobacterium tuberculosis variant microti OV254]
MLFLFTRRYNRCEANMLEVIPLLSEATVSQGLPVAASR